MDEEKKAEKEKREALEKVEEAKRALDQFKSEAEKVSEMANNVPKLSQNKKLYYSVSRLTFDKSAKKNEVKGFVVNPRKDDVNTFNFTIGGFVKGEPRHRVVELLVLTQLGNVVRHLGHFLGLGLKLIQGSFCLLYFFQRLPLLLL